MALFKREDDDDDFKLKAVSNFWNNNYIEYEGNGDRNKIITKGIS